MVGRSDQHHIDVLAFQQIAVVLEDPGRAAEAGPGLFPHVSVDITESNNIAVATCFFGDHRALVAESDGSHPESFAAVAWEFIPPDIWSLT